MKEGRTLHERQISLGTALMLCVMAAVVGIASCYVGMSWRTQAVQNKLREIDRLVADRYVGEMDTAQLADYAAAGYIAGLDDQWSGYIPAEQYAAYALRSEGKSSGIGASAVTREDSIRISLVYDGSPAQAAGLEKGDWIIGADGLTVAADGAQAVVDAIQGEEGEPVELTVEKLSGAVEQLTLTRAVVPQKMAWGTLLDSGVGYLRIESFVEGSAEQFQTVLDALLEQGARALVLDVRFNGGGLVKEMSAMLDPLLPAGTIITLTGKDGKSTVYSSDEAMLDLPLAVLIDDRSISAAEFFAAALQEYERATLVGVHTTGKGRAQRTYTLSDGSAVNLSVETYYTPEGRSLADVGIAPDVEVALSDEQRADFYFLTAENDTQLQKALEILA